jgi:anthranilate phosphoribosyltransferase
MSHLQNKTIRTFDVTPEALGFRRAAQVDIRGGSAKENAQIIRGILKGEKGPRRDVVLLNAAAAFVAAGLDPDFQAGTRRAAEAIDSGQAAQKLEALIGFSRSCIQSVRSLAS